MREWCSIVFAACAALIAAVVPLAAAKTQHSQPEVDSGGVVCSPGVYFSLPDDCLDTGPSVLLTERARTGLTVPASPLQASRADPELSAVRFRYFHVISDDPVGVGSAPGATGADTLFPGFVYIGYADRVDTGSGIYYLTQSGGWIPGKGERVGEIPAFQGLEFRSTPRSSFGWTFEELAVRSGPGLSFPEIASRLQPFSVVQIYSSQGSGVDEWNMIGPDQWIEARKVAQVKINTASPEGANGSPRWIDVDLAEQTLSVYQDRRLVFATMIATGVEPFWTRPGSYQIYSKVESETMRNNDPSDFYYLENVPWTMYFDGPRALHGAYWRTRFGYPQSHGCVNLSVGDAHWLYNWTQEGDWVFVHDPTGMTPTDPALYTGGAY